MAKPVAPLSGADSGEKARVRVLREGQNQRYTEVLSVLESR